MFIVNFIVGPNDSLGFSVLLLEEDNFSFPGNVVFVVVGAVVGVVVGVVDGVIVVVVVVVDIVVGVAVGVVIVKLSSPVSKNQTAVTLMPTYSYCHSKNYHMLQTRDFQIFGGIVSDQRYHSVLMGKRAISRVI